MDLSEDPGINSGMNWSLNSPPLAPLWESLGWQPQPSQFDRFGQLYAALLEANRQMNLTRITDEAEFWEKHIWDSLSGLIPWLESTLDLAPDRHKNLKKGIDIGTGGGFPGLVAAIVLPKMAWTLLDSTRKKVLFLQQVIESLNLTATQGIVDRAETLGQHPHHRDRYDLALIRAVGPASVCAEYCLPVLKVGGTAVLYRGQWTPVEEEHLTQILPLLGGQLQEVKPWSTPFSQSVRHCVYLEKVNRTAKTYPRAIGVPSQKPL